jgi:hypothetical protein
MPWPKQGSAISPATRVASRSPLRYGCYFTLLSRYNKPQRLKPLESRTSFGTNKVVPFPTRLRSIHALHGLPIAFSSRAGDWCLTAAPLLLPLFISDGGTVPACGRVGSPALRQQVHGAVNWNPHHPGGLIDPTVNCAASVLHAGETH